MTATTSRACSKFFGILLQRLPSLPVALRSGSCAYETLLRHAVSKSKWVHIPSLKSCSIIAVSPRCGECQTAQHNSCVSKSRSVHLSMDADFLSLIKTDIAPDAGSHFSHCQAQHAISSRQHDFQGPMHSTHSCGPSTPPTHTRTVSNTATIGRRIGWARSREITGSGKKVEVGI